jgi:hypothetical protein
MVTGGEIQVGFQQFDWTFANVLGDSGRSNSGSNQAPIPIAVPLFPASCI